MIIALELEDILGSGRYAKPEHSTQRNTIRRRRRRLHTSHVSRVIDALFREAAASDVASTTSTSTSTSASVSVSVRFRVDICRRVKIVPCDNDDDDDDDDEEDERRRGLRNRNTFTL
uniref:Uncharacterized protein n=1 Tax=Vespula pensylvanica TaxID=30213 RepID=A0A834PGV5_VESPE|nr:hypothetical protein H0235_001885 [Vespula pensylvanica]